MLTPACSVLTEPRGSSEAAHGLPLAKRKTEKGEQGDCFKVTQLLTAGTRKVPSPQNMYCPHILVDLISVPAKQGDNLFRGIQCHRPKSHT